MLIYEALKRDHEKLKQLLNQLVRSGQADDQTRERLIMAVRDELVPHARAEEAVFYNSLRTIEAAKELVVHSYEEHAEAEGLLRSLQAMDAINAEWTKTAEKLQKGILHHIQDEETRIFPAAQQVLIDEEARQMARAFEQMKPEVREGGVMQNTLDLIANMMPSRFSAPLRSFIHRV